MFVSAASETSALTFKRSSVTGRELAEVAQLSLLKGERRVGKTVAIHTNAAQIVCAQKSSTQSEACESAV